MQSLTEKQLNAYSPLALAFLGDSVYECMVRSRILAGANMPNAKLHNLAVRRVCAEYQSAAVDVILPMLTEQEQTVLRWGRNATGNTVPKHADVQTYRRATALECLFGYLYLLGRQDRLEELFAPIWNMELPTEE